MPDDCASTFFVPDGTLPPRQTNAWRTNKSSDSANLFFHRDLAGLVKTRENTVYIPSETFHQILDETKQCFSFHPVTGVNFIAARHLDRIQKDVINNDAMLTRGARCSNTPARA